MGNPRRPRPYQTLGDLVLDFAGHDQAADYARELDLDSAVARVAYQAGGVRFTREAFASAPDQVLVVRVEADRPGPQQVVVGWVYSLAGGGGCYLPVRVERDLGNGRRGGTVEGFTSRRSRRDPVRPARSRGPSVAIGRAGRGTGTR